MNYSQTCTLLNSWKRVTQPLMKLRHVSMRVQSAKSCGVQSSSLQSAVTKRGGPCQQLVPFFRCMQTDTPKKTPKAGPITWKSFGVLLLAGGAVIWYVRKIKAEKEKALQKEKTKSLGKASLGGPFTLVDFDGQPKSDKDFLGQWIILYFGFTFCPDICPDELEKLANVVKNIDSREKLPNLQPLFITVDPNRDTAEVMKKYLAEFHPKMLGLSGTPEQIKEAAKGYRVYYSVGPSDDDDDYLVDHTIITYLVNPKGEFVDYYGKNRNAGEMIAGIANHMIAFSKSKK